MVSELASNAVIHAGTPFSVSLRSDGSAVRISVRDREPDATGPAQRLTRLAIGTGPHLVAAMAETWGVDAGPDGKTVWAELRSLSLRRRDQIVDSLRRRTSADRRRDQEARSRSR